jgi:hypothetical protein
MWELHRLASPEYSGVILIPVAFSSESSPVLSRPHRFINTFYHQVLSGTYYLASWPGRLIVSPSCQIVWSSKSVPPSCWFLLCPLSWWDYSLRGEKCGNVKVYISIDVMRMWYNYMVDTVYDGSVPENRMFSCQGVHLVWKLGMLLHLYCNEVKSMLGVTPALSHDCIVL